MKICLISQNASSGLIFLGKDFIQHLESNGHEVFAMAFAYTSDTRDQVRALGAVPVGYV
jgi:hypothetical protein